MESMQESFLNEHKRQRAKIFINFVATKFAEQDVILTDQEIDDLTDHYLNTGNINKTLREEDKTVNRTINIRIEEEESRQIEEWQNEFDKKMPEYMDKFIQGAADSLFNSLTKRFASQKKWHNKDMRQFESNLHALWGKPLDHLMMMIFISQELGAEVNKKVRTKQDISTVYTMEVITRLHGRACQVAWEIHTLLKSGYADGAVARWRTLHEIAVTMVFVFKYGEPVAERYINYQIIDEYKSLKQLDDYTERLGYEPVDPAELEYITKEREKCRDLYGKNYLNDYGWAADVLQKEKPKFSDIEKACNIDYIRPYYKAASHNVHASSHGAFYKLGLLPDTPLILAGVSNVGLDTPGQCTAISLDQITSMLIKIDPTADTMIPIKIIGKICEIIRFEFLDVQKSIKEEE